MATWRGGRGHRWFAAFWDRASRHEGAAQKQTRRQVVGGAEGLVLEIGAGVGTNWAYLAAGARYVGTEPDPFMLARAARHATDEGRPVPLVRARAEALPFGDGVFDGVLATLVLCSVDHPDTALAEIRRVLRPGGTLHYWEHVRPAGRWRGRLFDALAPAWRRVGAGCRPNRDTERALREAGFAASETRRTSVGPVPFVSGTATSPGEAGEGR